MEIKKSPKADLENKRGLFLEIGLVVALVLVIGAFAVTPKEHRIEKVDLGYAPVEVEIVEVTREDQKPPEAPKKVDMAVVSDMLEVVTNDTKITTNVDFAGLGDVYKRQLPSRPRRFSKRRFSSSWRRKRLSWAATKVLSATGCSSV